MVVTESLFGIENSTYRIKHSAQRNQRDKLPRGITQKEREEEYHSPTHHQIYRQTDGRDRAATQGLIEDAEDHHHPLQDYDQPPLPTSDYGQGYGRIATRYGEVDEDMVEDVEYLFVASVVQHRVVESRNQEHHEDADAEYRYAHHAQYIAPAVGVAPYRCKGHSEQHQDAHYAVGDAVTHLLTECGDINFCHNK